MADHDVLSCDRLLDLSLEPNGADLDPDGHPYLIVDLGDAVSDGADAVRLARWLTTQPIPVIGLNPGRSDFSHDQPREPASIDHAVDIVVTEAELDQAVANIQRNPVASAVLMQVLRSSETLAVLDALTVESLAYATLQGGAEFADWVVGNRVAHPPRDSAADDVVLLHRTGDRLEIRLNSPATRNALSVAMRDGLTDAFKLVAVDDALLEVEVSANGPCFSAGGDLTEFGSMSDVANAHTIRMHRMPARYLAAHAERYTFRLHGACIGAGIELPAFAGRVTATTDTFFQLPEVGFGLIPGAGGCVSIPRRIGRQRTAVMAVLGERVPAERALAWGLIDAIVD